MSEPLPTDGFGHVVTVLSSKGGCGATTLATNLAVELAAGGARSVCLIDLDLMYGDVATVLDVEPVRTLADAVSSGQLNRTALPSILTRVGTYFDCVLAPAGPGEAEAVTPEVVGELIACLAMAYDHVVVDTSAQLTPNVLAALDSSDRHVLVAMPDRPALRHLRLLLDMLDLLPYRDRARSIVVNRCDSTVGLDIADIERAVNQPVAGALPSSWDVRAAVNKGVPLAVAQPGNPYIVALRRLVTKRPAAPGSLAPHGRESQ
jgi:pilus assembly protein CpaE